VRGDGAILEAEQTSCTNPRVGSMSAMATEGASDRGGTNGGA